MEGEGPVAIHQPRPGDAQTCPFEALGKGADEIDRYLSDAQGRLGRRNLNPAGELRCIAQQHRDPMFVANFAAMETRTQEAMKDRIVPYRNKIHRFALTLLECIQFADAGQPALEADCYAELQSLDTQLNGVFQDNRQALTALGGELHANVRKHHQQKNDARERQVLGHSASAAGAVYAVPLLAVPIVGLLCPAKIGNLGFFSIRVYAPVRETANGVIDYAKEGIVKVSGTRAVVLFGMGLGTLASAAWLWRRASAEAGRIASEGMLAKLNALHLQYVEENGNLWKGMHMWVEDVKTSIEVLKTLPAERVLMRRALLRDIAAKLFGMSMAVDEYICWLNKNDYFPQNFSIRNLLTPQRYDRIQTIVDNVG